MTKFEKRGDMQLIGRKLYTKSQRKDIENEEGDTKHSFLIDLKL